MPLVAAEDCVAAVRATGVGLTHAKALAYQWVRRVDRMSVLPRPAPFSL
jgi:hypothetical protein